MAAALRDAAKAAELEPAALAGIGVGSPARSKAVNVTQRPQPARLGRHVPARGGARESARLGGIATGRQRRAGRHRRRVQAGRRATLRLAARCLLGDRCWWRTDSRRQAVGRARGGRGDRAHGGRDRRRALHVWAARLHGGLRGARGDGSARARAPRRRGRQDRPVQADEGARAHAPDERYLGAGARARGQACDPHHRARGQGARRRDRLGCQRARRRRA